MWVMFPNYRFVDQSNQRTVFISKGSYLAAGFLGPAYLLFKSGPRKLLQSLAWSIGCEVGTLAFSSRGYPTFPTLFKSSCLSLAFPWSSCCIR